MWKCRKWRGKKSKKHHDSIEIEMALKFSSSLIFTCFGWKGLRGSEKQEKDPKNFFDRCTRVNHMADDDLDAIAQCLQQQLEECETLTAMFSGEGELEWTNANGKLDVADWLKRRDQRKLLVDADADADADAASTCITAAAAADPMLPSEIEFALNFTCGDYSMRMQCELPLTYPNDAPLLYCR